VAKWHIKLCSGSLAPSDNKHSPTNFIYKDTAQHVPGNYRQKNQSLQMMWMQH